jgi:1-deoxy-D-xylulose-5-phosphate reductoisomerase
VDAGVPALDLVRQGALTFEAPDHERFPCIGLAMDALLAGGTAPAVLNAANEVAVAAFLAGRIRYTDIAPACAEVLARLPARPAHAIDDALAADGEARAVARAWLKLPVAA